MQTANLKSMIVKGMTVGLIAGAFALAAPVKAQAQGFSIQFGAPAYYGDRDDYFEHERAEHIRAQEIYAQQEAYAQRQAYLQHEAFERHQAEERRERFARNYRDRDDRRFDDDNR